MVIDEVFVEIFEIHLVLSDIYVEKFVILIMIISKTTKQISTDLTISVVRRIVLGFVLPSPFSIFIFLCLRGRSV